MKKTTIAGLSAATLAAGLGLGAASLANADTTSPTPTPSASSSTDPGTSAKPERDGHGMRGGGHGARGGSLGDTSTLATKLGVTEDALKSALEKARESLKSDDSTERTKPSEQTDEQKEARRAALITAVAKELGLDEAKVTAAVDEARAARTAEREASQKEKLDAAVTDGKLTQAEADAVQKALDAGIVELRGRGR